MRTVLAASLRAAAEELAVLASERGAPDRGL